MWQTLPDGEGPGDRPPPCWHCGPTRGRGSRGSFPAKSPDRSGAGRRLSRSRLPCTLETIAHFDQIFLAEAEELSCQVHEALLVLANGPVAESDRPHSLHQGESLALAETPAQPAGVLGKAGFSIVLGLRRRLSVRREPPAIPQVGRDQVAIRFGKRGVGISQLQNQQGGSLLGRPFGDLRTGQKRGGRGIQRVTGGMPYSLPLPATPVTEV